jgi:hypothetical protein
LLAGRRAVRPTGQILLILLFIRLDTSYIVIGKLKTLAGHRLTPGAGLARMLPRKRATIEMENFIAKEGGQGVSLK